MRVTWLASAVVVAAGVASGVGAQSPAAGQAQVADIMLSADTVSFGDTFELLLEIHVPAGEVAQIPDALPATDQLEGLGQVEWASEPGSDGTTLVLVVYPLIAYRVGTVVTPEFGIFVGPPVGQPEAGAAPGPVTTFLTDAGGSDSQSGMTRHVVPAQTAWVNSLLTLEDAALGLEPRPADDVIGPSWNAPAVISTFAFLSLLLGVAFVSGRDWVGSRARRGGGTGGATLDSVAAARNAALAELDRLLEAGLEDPNEAEAFYAASSAAVRRYVEHLDHAWGPAYTSTELMRGLEARTERDALRAVLGEMSLAEVVKFGRLRPESDAALEHCRTLRAWVAAS